MPSACARYFSRFQRSRCTLPRCVWQPNDVAICSKNGAGRVSTIPAHLPISIWKRRYDAGKIYIFPTPPGLAGSPAGAYTGQKNIIGSTIAPLVTIRIPLMLDKHGQAYAMRILVIEDDPDGRNVLAQGLAECGH